MSNTTACLLPPLSISGQFMTDIWSVFIVENVPIQQFVRLPQFRSWCENLGYFLPGNLIDWKSHISMKNYSVTTITFGNIYSPAASVVTPPRSFLYSSTAAYYSSVIELQTTF